MRLKLKGKIGITLLVVCLVFSSLSLSAYSGISAEAASITDNEVFLKQTQSGRCTLSSVAMMLRRKALLDGNGNWSSITEETLLSTAWVMNQGLRWSFSYAGMSVNYGNFSGNAQNKKEQLTSLLNQHPEGVVIYMYGGGNYTHAVLATSYENGTVYVADPAGYLPKGIIPMTSAYLSGSTQDERIGNLKMYWYVSNGSCNLATPAPAPAIHTHSWSYKNDSTHPHSQYRICSCGAKEYTSARFNVPSCAQCRPLGNVKLTRSFNKVSGNANFRRNNVSNATSYTLTLYKDGVQYGSYNMSSLTSYSVTGLSAGNYSATLTARNDNTGETRSGSCSNFKIVNTYSVNYDANGGSGAPSGQSKIQNEALTLSSSKPSKPHYVFKGWASSRTADVPQYQPGGFYSKNSKITLYAVWEPETYNVKFDLNGGKGECSDRTITYGDTAKMPNSAVKDGFYLKGWSAQKNASNPDYKLGIDYKIDSNLTLYAVWGNSTWTDEVASSFAGGDGTEQNPYLISNASELAYLAQLVNSQSAAPEYKYYKLTDNINLGYSEWIPIGLGGNENQYFCGQFDGNGYTISDLYITKESEGYAGLFGFTKNSEISNLTLTGAIESINSSNTLKIGGVAGYIEETNIKNTEVKYFNIGSISAGSNSTVGMIAGQSLGGEITDCNAYDDTVNLKKGNYSGVGMLIGDCSSEVVGCTVESTEDGLFSTAQTVGDFIVGGMCGILSGTANKCSIKAPYFSNNIKANGGPTIGGLIGKLNGEIRVCSVQFADASSNSITLNGTGLSVYIGGVVGTAEQNSTIIDCKFDGKTITGTTTGEYLGIGGLVGFARAKSNAGIWVRGGENLQASLLPQKNGYTATWYSDSNCTIPYTFSEPVTGNMTLYAKWKKGDNSIKIWDGSEKEPAYNAITKTYTISSGEELAWIANVANGKTTGGINFPSDISFNGYTVELTSDIYLNNVSDINTWKTNAPKNVWKPINKFSGTFKGNYYRINGMYCNASDCGLFGTLYKDSSLSELIISDSLIYMSAICGGSSGAFAINNYGKISNCYNYSDIYISAVKEGYHVSVGGICSENGGEITNCINRGKIQGLGTTDNYFIGGIAQYNSGSIKCCFNSGYIYSSYYAAGIATGTTGTTAAIVDCYNSGNISGKYVGGIANEISGGIIEYCYNVGELTSSGRLGEIVQTYFNRYDLEISNCYYTHNNSAYNIPGYYYGDNKITINNVIYTSATNLGNMYGINLSSNWCKGGADFNYSYPCLKPLEETYKQYKITTVTNNEKSINRAIVNIDGNISGKALKTTSVGGIIGWGYGLKPGFSENKSIVAMIDSISSSNSNNSYSAYAGSIIGNNLNNIFTFDNAYYDTDMDISSSTNSIDATSGTAKSKKTMNISFYTNILGLTPYSSLKGVDDNEQAVWVFKANELPELYYNCLRDITISKDIENGTVATDKAQAIDGEAVTLSVKPNDGYELNTVYVNGKEIAGTSFEMSGNADIYATFKPVTPEYSVKVEANSNATASLTKNDESSIMLLSAADATQLTAKDGEEVLVNTAAAQNYTVDSVYVNGEEIAANSFIVTDDSTVTLAVQSLSTDIKAVTNDAAEIGPYFATLSGEVQDDNGNVKYIRYWKADEPETVFVTEPGTESGTYSATVMLDSDTEYEYQMLENGEIKSFKTLSSDDGAYQENTVLTETVCTSKNGVHTFDITLKKDIGAKMVMLALYDSADKLLCVKNLTFEESKLKLDINAPTCSTAKIFVWDISITPQSVSEVIKVKNN